MTSNIIKYSIIIILILFLIIGGIIGGNKLYKNIKAKKDLVGKIDNINNNLSNLEKNLLSNQNIYSNKYYSDNLTLEEILLTNDFKNIEEIDNEKSTNLIVLNIDEKYLAKEFPQTIEEMSNTIIAMQKTINKMNQIRKEDKIYITKVITNTVVQIKEIQTNMTDLRKDVITYVKPKFISFGVGAGFSINGKASNGDILYDVTAHGTLYFLDTWYIGIAAGVNYNLTYSPKIGAFIGVKF